MRRVTLLLLLLLTEETAAVTTTAPPTATAARCVVALTAAWVLLLACGLHFFPLARTCRLCANPHDLTWYDMT